MTHRWKESSKSRSSTKAGEKDREKESTLEWRQCGKTDVEWYTYIEEGRVCDVVVHAIARTETTSKHQVLFSA